jgi:drug/metabolite transporter (DMT)-like permease
LCCIDVIDARRTDLRGASHSGVSGVIGEIAAMVAALSFGLSTVLARRFMGAVAPEAGVLVSIAMNVTVFAAISVLAALRGALPPITGTAVFLFAAGGLAGTLLGRNLSYLSLNRLGASLTVTVRLSNSVFSLLIGLLLLHELPRSLQLLGMVAVTLGLWLGLRPAGPGSDGSVRPTDWLGITLALAAAAAFAFGDTARRAGLHLMPAPVVGAAIGATSALLAHLAWSVFNHDARWPSPAVLRRFDVLASGVLNTVAILLLYIGLQHAPVAIVSVLYNLQVLVVLLTGPVILRGQERLTPWLVAGSVLALLGTTLILIG